MTAAARMLAVTWWLHLKMLAASAFDGILQVALAAVLRDDGLPHLPARTPTPRALLYAGLGAGRHGHVVRRSRTTASSALQRERWHGTLELLVAAPTRFALVLLPITIAMATIGVYSMVATLLWGWLLFGIVVPVASPVLFVARRIVVSILAMAMFGFLLSVTRRPLPHRLGPRATCSSTPAGCSAASSSRSRSSRTWVDLDLLGAAARPGAWRRSGSPRPASRPWLALARSASASGSGVCGGRRPALGEPCSAPPAGTRRWR